MRIPLVLLPIAWCSWIDSEVLRTNFELSHAPPLARRLDQEAECTRSSGPSGACQHCCAGGTCESCEGQCLDSGAPCSQQCWEDNLDIGGASCVASCAACWGVSAPFQDHFFVNPHVQPVDEYKQAWESDFRIIVSEMHLAGYDNSSFTDPRQFCSLPVVFCDGPKGGPYADPMMSRSDNLLSGGRDAYYRRKYFLFWFAADGYTAAVPLPPSAGKLQAVIVFRAMPTGGLFPEGMENIGNGELNTFDCQGNGTHGIVGPIPSAFWNLPTKTFLLTQMPGLEGPHPTKEQAGICDHLTQSWVMFRMPSYRGHFDFLTRCKHIRRLYLRSDSINVFGNAWNVLYENRELSEVIVAESVAGGVDDPAHDWDAWCRADKLSSYTRDLIVGGQMRYAVQRLEGTFPAGMAACAERAHVFQFFGSFTGNFPFSLKPFTKIEAEQLFFGGEPPGFTGRLPEMPVHLKVIQWAGHQFTGPIPEQWAELRDLISIDISRNRISVPPLPWGHVSDDKTLPRIRDESQPLPAGLFKPAPVWSKFSSLNVAHNPIGWHQGFFFSSIARYPTLRSVDASNTGMFGMAGDFHDQLIWDENMELVNSGGGLATSLEDLILNDNDLLGLFMFGSSLSCRSELCPTASTVGTSLLRNVFLPSLRSVQVLNNPRLRHVSPSVYSFAVVDLRGTAANGPVTPARETCQTYVLETVALNHEGVSEAMPVCLFRQKDFVSHPTDDNALCAGVSSMNPATGSLQFLSLDSNTFNDDVLCKCVEGYQYPSSGERTCSACPVDTYRSEDVGEMCVSCPPFSTTDGRDGQASVEGCLCNAGYAKIGAVCEPCPADSFNEEVGMSSLGACIACKDGKVTRRAGTGKAAECLCPTGTYTDGEACRACPKGRYCDEIGMTEGKLCENGHSTLGVGSKSALQCVCEGQRMDATGQLQPGYFDEGFLQALQNSQDDNGTDVLAMRVADGQCRLCPGGMVCHGGLELLQRVDRYPVEYYPTMGESSSDELGMTLWSICKTDPELVDGNVVNQNCLRRFCEDESRAADPRCKPTFPELAVGHWADPESPLDVYKCQALISSASDKFLSCPGGRPGMCSGGRTGLACGRCEDGMYMDVDGLCNECVSGSSAPTILVVIVILMGFPCLYYLINGKITSETSTMMATGISMGSLLTLTQHFSVIGQLLTSWDEPMKSIWAILAVFMFDPKFLNSGCVFGDTTTFVGRILLPTFLLGWLTLFAIATQAGGKVGVVKESLVMVWPKVRNTMGQMFQAFYIAIAMSCILALQCYSSPNGTSSLSQHPYILCGSGDHTPFLVFSVLGMIVYLFGFGAFYITACIVIPGRSQRGLVAIQAYRFIFFRFRPEFWYWGSVFLFRNLLLTLAGVLNPGNPYTGAMYLGLVALGFLIAQCVCWPWRSNLLNTLDTVILFAMVAIVFSTLPFIEVTEVEVLESTRDTLVGIMVTVFVLASLTVVGSILGNMACKVREVRDPDGHIQRKEASMKTLSKAWADLTNCYRLDASRQMQFLTNLGAFDRAAVLKLAGVVDLELSRSEKGSKRSSRRVSMNAGSLSTASK